MRVTGSSPRSLVERGQLPLMQIIAGWCFWDKVFILLFSSPCSKMLRTICPSSWTHLARAKFGCNRKISSTWSIRCFVTELSPPTTSLLGLEWMGLVESYKDILKGYRSRNILRVIMVKFRSILPSYHRQAREFRTPRLPTVLDPSKTAHWDLNRRILADCK